MTKRNLTAAKVARARKAGIRTALMLSTGALALAAAAPALAQVPDVNALPGGGGVVGGTGTINAPVGNHLQVDQTSDRLLINWNNFDIGENASVDFDQQAGDQSIAVNRVIGSGTTPSLIFGELTANGTVVIINGNGVIFGGTADVDVGRLVATTSDVDGASFMNSGALQFSGLSSDAGAISILSGANISVAEAGLAAFVAPRVSNAGVITARGGRVVLASGVDYTLDLAGDGLIEFALGADSPLVTQAGQILAEGGLVQITAAAAAGLISDVINVSGAITVTSVDLEDGVIVLSAGEGDGGGVNVSSDLTVSGDIEIEGRRIHGAGDVDVTDGELVLNVNAGGADTTGETLIADALGVIGTVTGGTTLGLGAGDYRGGAIISSNNVTLAGSPGARIVVPALPAGQEMNGLTISADNVTIRDLEIVGPALNQSWQDFAWNAPATGGTTRGIAVWVGADNFTIADNVIQGLRTGIVIDGRNAGGSVTGNLIDNTKSGISVQYTDAGLLNAEGFAFTISGNDDGQYGNEWGANFHLNGHQEPGGLVGNAVKIANTAGSAVQTALLAWSAANNGMSAQDQGYNFANRTHVNVAVGGGVNSQGSLLSAIGSVQGGVDAVVAGGTVQVQAGVYDGTLSITKSVSVLGAGAGQTILRPTTSLATGVGHKYDANMNVAVFISGADNVVLDGLTIDGNGLNNNAAVFWHNASGTISNAHITNVRPFSGVQTGQGLAVTATAGNTVDLDVTDVVFDNWNKNAIDVVTGAGASTGGGDINLTVTGGSMTGRGATSTIAQNGIVLWERAGGTVNAVIEGLAISDLEFTGADVASGILQYGSPNGQLAVHNSHFNDLERYIALSAGSANGADATANVFDGVAADSATLAELFAIEDRIEHGVDAAGVGLVSVKDGHLFATATAGNLGRAIDLATDGDTVNIADGTHNIGSTRLIVDESITLTGQSQAGTIIDGRGVGGGLGTMLVSADDVSLSNFTLYGADSGVNNYGIKVQPNPSAYSPTQRLYNFSISDVTVQGSTRAELDLNGVIGATITNFTANGYRVGTTTATGGAGIQITDSQAIYLSGVTTLGNDWGSVAIYQSNKAGAYDGLTNNINIDGTNSDFSELLGVFAESYSTLHPQIGQLNLTGFDYAVRNPGHRASGENFTFFRRDLADATSFALGLANAGSGSIEGYTGTAYTNAFTVVDGLLINSALRDVRAGGVVNVGAGTFNETVAITRGVTLDGAGMDDTFITGGIALSGAISDLVLSDFSVSGVGGSNTVVRNSGVVTGFTMDGVRVDGDSVAGRFGVIGGQFGGDLSITDSEFLNINGWAVFDTRSGAGTNQGSVIASAVFSNNLMDNVQGHVNFRHDLAAGAFPDVVISGNTVTNVGDATNSFGAIFKAFNADSVIFSGNSVSDIGTSGFNPAGEAAYGAVLMVRGASDLTVSNNSFTNNHMVFAVEPGRGLATHTTITGNIFTNNAYALYMPANAPTGGTVSFGAGNNFIAGADTVQHIVWRGAAGLDLTGVEFDGRLGSDMDLAELFALEDLISHGVDVAGAGLVSVADGQLFVTEGSGVDAALRALALADSGDTLNLSAGTHILTNTLFIQDDGVSVAGQGQGQTILDASGHGAYGIRVHGDDVSLSGFTLNGSAAATNASYGVKVEAASGSGSAGRNTGFSIADVTINGSRKTGLDLNSVRDVVIDGVTVTGVIAGNGIAITDSAGVVISNTTTSGNAWGGLALYQRNNFSDQQLTDITVDASNSFGETNGVYLQQYASALHQAGALTIEGFDFVVQNDQQDGGATAYAWFQKTQQGAIDFAVNVANTDASLVQGFDGSAGTGEYYVGAGALLGGGTRNLSIQTAFDGSTAGDTVHIASGDYAESLTLDGRRTVLFGQVGVTGLTIAAGAGGTSLAGDLTAGAEGLTFASDISLADDLSLTTTDGGDIDLAGVDGGQSLTIVGSDSVTLQAAAGLASLDITGASIASGGALTTGAQRFDADDIRLAGDYQAGGAFTATGAVELTGDVSIGAGGAVNLGAVDGGHGLIIDGGGVTLGMVGSTDALASLDVTGTTIVTAGATTTGVQTWLGALTLAGAYAASDFSAGGAATLAADSTIDASGDVTLAPVNGGHRLSIAAGGAADLGPVGGTTALASLSVSGASIRTHGAVTTGGQTYSGPVSFAGDYRLIGAGDFTASGATTLTGDTGIETRDGAIVLGSVNGASAGGQSLTLDAGSNSATVGDFGSQVRLGAVQVHAARTVLQGNVYAGDSLRFTGGDGATVRLTRASTTFNTTRSGGAAGDITIQPHLIGTTSGGQGVVFIAGNGLSSGASGDITLGDAGTEAVRLGAMTATGDNFSAATVKLAGDYTSLLAGDQVFTDQTLDTQGDAMMTIGGNESGSIVVLGSVFIEAGGSTTGTLTAGGPVVASYGAGSDRVITSGGPVSLSSTGGVIGGSITSGGAVNISGGGNVSTTIAAQGNVGVTTGGAITSTITTPTEVTLNAGQLVDVTVNAGSVVVNAPGGTVEGVFTEITTPGDTTLIVNGEAVIGEGSAAIRQILVDSFVAPAGGVVGPNGQIELPVGLAIALIAPAGAGEGQRRPIIVNDIARLGELLRLGYTAIVVQMDEGDEPAFEQELDLAQGEETTPAG